MVRASKSKTTAACRVVPAGPDSWADVEQLFGERGACGGCWCMAWRLPTKAWEAGKGAAHKARLKKLVVGGGEPGVLAYLGDEVVGWCSIAPRQEFVKLERSRVLKPIDDEPVWSISCFFVARPHRRRGVAVELLRGACAFAAERGARIVEGYPVIPRSDGLPDVFAWTGIPRVFERAGFEEAHRWSASRPIMRWQAPPARGRKRGS